MLIRRKPTRHRNSTASALVTTASKQIAAGATAGFAQQCRLIALTLQLEHGLRFPIARMLRKKHG